MRRTAENVVRRFVFIMFGVSLYIDGESIVNHVCR